METAHHLESWRDLYVMLGTSSAALLGLLFVATSLHLQEIIENPAFQRRARSNIQSLIFLLVEAAVILVPQAMTTLAAALFITTLVMLWFPVRNAYVFLYKNREVGKHGGWMVSRAIAFIAACILGVSGSVLVMWRLDWGLSLVTGGYVLTLATVAFNSWSIMIGIGEMERTAKNSARKGH